MNKFVRQFFLLFVLDLLNSVLLTSENEELFQQDIGDQMTIGISDQGYKSVHLKCGADSMSVDIETDQDFEGVIYTRGSFYEKSSPCFLDPSAIDKNHNRSFSLKLPFDKCNTKKEGDLYSNVLILQHDKELIMPGDAAFNLECDFTKDREFIVNTSMEKVGATSRITLTSADPGAKKMDAAKPSIQSLANSVILNRVLPKEEL